MCAHRSDFGDTSGVTSGIGFHYQKIVAIYYLVVEEAREIEYEPDGQDISIINENRNRNSVDYIQVKHLGTGSFSLADFYKKVFPQLWDAYSGALTRYNDKAIYCTLFTNVAWHDTLRDFAICCEKQLHDRGMPFSQFESSIPKRKSYETIKLGKDEDEFKRFLWGFKVISSFTLEHVKDKIIAYMKSCEIRDPQTAIAVIEAHIDKIGQGPITRRQIEELIGHNLTPTKSTTNESIYTDSDIVKILSDLDETKSKYVPESDYPDKEALLRDMTQPVKKVSKALNYHLSEKSNAPDYSSEEITEAREITISDEKKALDKAREFVDLQSKLWACGMDFGSSLTSMKKTANRFGIKKDD